VRQKETETADASTAKGLECVNARRPHTLPPRGVERANHQPTLSNGCRLVDWASTSKRSPDKRARPAAVLWRKNRTYTHLSCVRGKQLILYPLIRKQTDEKGHVPRATRSPSNGRRSLGASIRGAQQRPIRARRDHDKFKVAAGVFGLPGACAVLVP
jgi:hypothetical protein